MQATGFVANELIVQLLQSGYTVRGETPAQNCLVCRSFQVAGLKNFRLYTCRHCEVTR